MANVLAAIRAGGYGTTLLRGVTGSGKTEVYLEAVAECLRHGRQALVMLPEIALSAEFLDRVDARTVMDDKKLDEAIRRITRNVAMDEIGKKPEVKVIISRLAAD